MSASGYRGSGSRGSGSRGSGSRGGPGSPEGGAPREAFIALREQVREALAADELFSPHAELVLERVGTLGEGGMGVVYRVRDRRLGREAALKLLKSRALSPRRRERFLRELRLTARMDHPGIPPVYDGGRTADGQLFMLMKLIDGETLDELAARAEGEDERRACLEALARVAEALAYAHDRGIIHRDIKPANIMIGAFGEVYLVDWGLARDMAEGDERDESVRALLSAHDEAGLDASDGDSELTRAGAIVGTLGYMPPEQAEGRPVGPAADIFALGASLVAVLCGRKVYVGGSAAELIAATLQGEPLRVRALLPSAPAELDWIAAAATRRAAAERTADAALFAAQLRAYLEGRPVPGYRAGPLERLRRRVARRPGRFLAAGLILILLVMGGALTQELVRSRRAERRSARFLELLGEARDGARRGASSAAVKSALERALELGGRKRAPLMEAAAIYEEAGERLAAVACLDEVAERFPPAYDALYALHRLEVERLGYFAWTGPLERLRSLAEERGEENEFTLFSQGADKVRAGANAEAIALFDRAEAAGRGFAMIFSSRGVARSRLGDVEGALVDYNAAIALDPRSSVAYYNRGAARCKLERWRSAILDFDRSLALNPRYAKAMASRGAARYAILDRDGAFEDYTAALAMKPGLHRVHISLAVLHDEGGAPAKAEAAYGAAIAAFPERGDLRGFRGDVRVKLEEWAGAVEDYSAALARQKPSAELYEKRAGSRYRLGEKRGAIEDFSAALALEPKRASCLFQRGLVYKRRDQARAAIADFDALLALEPEHVEGTLNRGLTRLELGDAGGAQDLRRFLSLAPAHPLADAIRGKLGLRRGP